MKTFTQYHEGWFSKKEKEDPDAKELGDLGMKAAGRGGWSKKEQDRYNDLWMKMHKKGKTPSITPPAVYDDDSWEVKLRNFIKNLNLQQKTMTVC